MADSEQDAFDAQAFAQITSAPPSPAPAAAPDQPAPVTESAEPVSSEGDVQVDTTPLKLIGVPQSVLDSLSKSDLQQWSSQTREREAKRATDIQQRSEEAKHLRDELGRFKSQPEATRPAEPQAPTAEMDLEAELKPIVDELTEMGVPAGKKLASVLKSLNASQRAQVEGLSSVNKQLVGEVIGFFEDQTRSKLEAQYPQLSDDALWTKVRDGAQPFLSQYKDLSARKAIDKAFGQAAKLELFDDIVKSQTEKALTQHHKRVQGAPTAPTRQPDMRPMNDEERDLAVARALIGGKPDDALRIARG